MDLLMVDIDNQRGQPGLKLREGESRLRLGPVGAALSGMRERCARQGMNGLIERATKALDIAAIVGLSDRPPVQIDAEVLTRPVEHATAELFGIVGMHDSGF